MFIPVMGDGIIDIRKYLGSDEDDASAFSLWGGEGERSRFALPLWRIIYLAGGDRGGIVSAVEAPMPQGSVGVGLEPLVVLDLRSDPARTDFSDLASASSLVEGSPRLVDLDEGGLLVALGERAGRQWFVAVDGVSERIGPLARSVTEDILFLSGECAGLLFFRDLAQLEE